MFPFLANGKGCVFLRTTHKNLRILEGFQCKHLRILEGFGHKHLRILEYFR